VNVSRQGSGSACRSMYGGFVEWTVGNKNDGTDSIARQIATEDHWPNLHVLIVVVLSAVLSVLSRRVYLQSIIACAFPYCLLSL